MHVPHVCTHHTRVHITLCVHITVPHVCMSQYTTRMCISHTNSMSHTCTHVHTTQHTRVTHPHQLHMHTTQVHVSHIPMHPHLTMHISHAYTTQTHSRYTHLQVCHADVHTAHKHTHTAHKHITSHTHTHKRLPRVSGAARTCTGILEDAVACHGFSYHVQCQPWARSGACRHWSGPSGAWSRFEDCVSGLSVRDLRTACRV